MKLLKVFCPILSLCLACSLAVAQEKPVPLSQAHPEFGFGILTNATSAALPDGVIVKSGDFEIKAEAIEKEIAAVPDDRRAVLELPCNAGYVLERVVMKQVLLDAARQDAKVAGVDVTTMNDQTLMKTFIEKQVKDVTVTEEEIQAFYARIKAEVEKSGKTFEDVRPAIIQSQLSPKKQEATAVFIRGQGKTRSIQVSQKWIADNSAAVRDNVLDKAIGKGKPVLVEFGRKEGCPWCKQMEPVLKEIGQMKAEALDIIMVETPEEPALAARFNITGVPVQVYFDKDGKQVFSHVGFFAKEDLLKRLTESGLK